MPNKQISELFWAFVIAIVLASALAAIGYIIPRPDTATQAIFRISDSLITGALGFFAGSAVAQKMNARKDAEDRAQ